MLLVLLAGIDGWAQYNPTNPDEPGTAPWTLTLKSVPADAGSFNISKVTSRAAGASVTVKASNNGNYYFQQWEQEDGTVVSTSASYTFTMPAANKTLVARYTYSPSNPDEPSVPSVPAKNVSITVGASPSDGGSVSPSGTKMYAAGTKVSLSASPNSNFAFVNWTENDKEISTSRTLSYEAVTDGARLVAHFRYSPASPDEPNVPSLSYPLYLKASPSGGGSFNISSGNTYQQGSKVSVQAYTNNGYVFKNWTFDGEVVSSSASFTYTMPNHAVTLVANYAYSPGNPDEPGVSTTERYHLYGMHENALLGKTVKYPVYLENTGQVTGFSVDVAFPDGFSADASNASLTARAGGQTMQVENLGGNAYRFLVRGTNPIAGVNGMVLEIPLTVPSDEGLVGNTFTIGLSKGVIFKADGSQTPITVRSGSLKVEQSPDVIPDSPDFQVSDIAVRESESGPGELIHLSWKVKNVGPLAAGAGWSERIYLVNASGRKVSIGSTHYDTDAFGPGASVTREADIALGRLLGIDGDTHVSITVIPEAAAGEATGREANNTAESSGKLAIKKVLYLSVPEDVLQEGVTTTARCQLARSGNWMVSEVFDVSILTGDSRLKVPATVTIPKDQSSAYFYLTLENNDLLDESGRYAIQASGNGYPAVNGIVMVEDDELPAITLTASKGEVNEGETFQLTAVIPRALDSNLEVGIAAEYPKRFSFTSPIVIPAGQTSAQLAVTVVNDDTPSIQLSNAFTASAAGHANGEAIVILNDDDIPALSLTLTPNRVSEGAGVNAVAGILRRTGKTNNKITVKLTDDASGKLYFGNRTLELAKGVEEIHFNFGPVDNSTVDGDRTYTVTAAVWVSSCNCSASGESAGSVSAPLEVYDDDGATLSISSQAATVKEGGKTTLTISRNTATSQALTVSLSSDYDDHLTYDHTVTIPAGQKSVSVEVSSKSNAIAGDSHTVVFTVSANGYSSGTCYLMITDQTLPDARISSLTADKTEAKVGERAIISIVVENNGAVELPSGVAIDVIRRGVSLPSFTLYTKDVVPVGGKETLSRSLLLPSDVGTHTYYAIINPQKTIKELSYTNNNSTDVSISVCAPYTVTVQTDKSFYQQGDDVTISGHLTGSDTAETSVDIYLINEGARQVNTIRTDAQGHFTYQWKLFDLQCGHFSLGACYPNEAKTQEMASFDVYGLRRANNDYVKCDVIQGNTHKGKIEIVNPGELDLTGATVELLSVPENCEASLTIPALLKGKGVVDLSFSLKGLSPSLQNKWDEVKARVHTHEGATLDVTLYFFCRYATGKLQPTVNTINTTVSKGTSREYKLEVINIGSGNTGNITLALPEFIKSITGNTLPSIDQGDTLQIALTLVSTDDMQLNVPVTGNIGINCANGDGCAVSFSMTPVSEETGTLTIDVCDEFTFYTQEAPHVAGAQVEVYNPVTNVLVCQGTTDSKGTYSVVLHEGYYKINVKASKHDTYSAHLFVDPGVVTSQEVILSYNAVEIGWSVEETEVEDVYEINTVVKYETNVPKPVIIMEGPKKIDGDALAVGESRILIYTFTNKGLVRADNVELFLPEASEEFSITPLAETRSIALEPQSTFVVPVLFTRHSESSRPQSSRRKAGTPTPYRGTYFGDCMAGYIYQYEDFCKHLIRTNKAAFSLAFRACFVGAITNSFLSMLSGFGQGISNLGAPMGSPSDNKNSNADINNLSIDKSRTICNPEVAEAAKNAIENPLGCMPFVGPIISFALSGFDLAEEIASNGYPSAGTLMNIGSNLVTPFLPVAGHVAGRHINGKVGATIGETAAEMYLTANDAYNVTNGFVDLANKIGGKARRSPARASGVSGISWLDDYFDKAQIWLSELKEHVDIQKAYFGQPEWYTTYDKSIEEFLLKLQSLHDNGFDVEKLKDYKPESISEENFDLFIERLNNTLTNSESDNKIDIGLIVDKLNTMSDIETASRQNGYSSTLDMYNYAVERYKDEVDKASGSVCATVSIKLSQTMAMTRQAFRGTLTVFNGHETTAMKDVKLTLNVTSAEGKVSTAHEFQINAETISGFKGDVSLTSGWTLDANATGTANILFIPTKYAAPTEPVEYHFGGTLSYVDPFTGLEVMRELFPVSLTVKPSPELDLTYFMQRDIYGDDPLTTDKVEPMIPAEFALLINNKGNGDATNVRMVTQQPEIIDNEKGLSVDFEIVSSQVNGNEANLAFGKSVANDFGTILAHSQAYAQWWMTSTLLGHFTAYDVKASHLTSYGNEDLSLLGEVTIHELIRSLDLTADGQKTAGFLCNDIPDTDDLPDMLYLSNGETQNVGTATATVTKASANAYRLTLTPSASGWVYGSVADPTQGMSELKHVVRQSDGKEISLRNFWQTDRTLRDGKDPLYEYRLHFADECSSTAGETYVLTFEPLPDVILAVASIEGVPAEGAVAVEPVNTLTVSFTKPVKPETFTAEDLTFTVQGARQDTKLIGISTNDNQNFLLDLKTLTEQCSNGYYVLSVQTSGITDKEGYQGKDGTQASWILFRGGLVRLLTSAYPENSGAVQRKSGNAARTVSQAGSDDNSAAYGSKVTLVAVAKPGYEFAYWTLNGEQVSTEPEYEALAINDLDIVANFTKKSFSVEVETESDGGTIVGSGTGLYEYDSKLQLTAVADEDFAFQHWLVNDNPMTGDTKLSLSVDKALDVKAVFYREFYRQTLSMARGWNWISTYLQEPLAVSTLTSYMNRIVGQTDEMVNDPEYGLVGPLTMLEPGKAYKFEASRSFASTLRGHRYDTASSPITLRQGWNWMAYPWQAEGTLSTVVTNADEGDYIVSQTGFAEFADSRWEGSFNTFVPGEGYLYKSSKAKTLSLDFSRVSGARSRRAAVTDKGDPLIDIHRYPNTMSMTIRLERDDIELPASSYNIYAMVDGEMRGISRAVGDYHYLTVYGDNTAEVSFLVESIESGEAYKAQESLEFRNDVVGSRKMPYIMKVGGSTGIETIGDTSRPMTVYSLQGILVSRDATLKSVKRLPKGVYIVNGRKCYIK